MLGYVSLVAVNVTVAESTSNLVTVYVAPERVPSISSTPLSLLTSALISHSVVTSLSPSNIDNVVVAPS